VYKPNQTKPNHTILEGEETVKKSITQLLNSRRENCAKMWELKKKLRRPAKLSKPQGTWKFRLNAF